MIHFVMIRFMPHNNIIKKKTDMCPKVTEQMPPEMCIRFTIFNKFFNNKKEYLH